MQQQPKNKRKMQEMYGFIQNDFFFLLRYPHSYLLLICFDRRISIARTANRENSKEKQKTKSRQNEKKTEQKIH